MSGVILCATTWFLYSSIGDATLAFSKNHVQKYIVNNRCRLVEASDKEVDFYKSEDFFPMRIWRGLEEMAIEEENLEEKNPVEIKNIKTEGQVCIYDIVQIAPHIYQVLRKCKE